MSLVGDIFLILFIVYEIKHIKEISTPIILSNHSYLGPIVTYLSRITVYYVKLGFFSYLISVFCKFKASILGSTSSGDEYHGLEIASEITKNTWKWFQRYWTPGNKGQWNLGDCKQTKWTWALPQCFAWRKLWGWERKPRQNPVVSFDWEERVVSSWRPGRPELTQKSRRKERAAHRESCRTSQVFL